MRIIVAGDSALKIGSIEILNLFNYYEKRRIDTACKIIQEASFNDFVNFLKTEHPGIPYPTNKENYPYIYIVEIMD